MTHCLTLSSYTLSLFLFILLKHSAARRYTHLEEVAVDVDTIGPFNNPAQRYDYYSLPVCRPDKIIRTSNSLGDNLSGSMRQNSLFNILFTDVSSNKVMCKKQLTSTEVDDFIHAIDNDYTFNLYVDNLPVLGFYGKKLQLNDVTDESNQVAEYYIFTHYVFALSYNDDSIITVNLTADMSKNVVIKQGHEITSEITFSYETTWSKTDTLYRDRLAVHSKHLWGDQSMEIHWLSIINSFVLVLLLTAFLGVILMRVLRNDLTRYMEADNEEIGTEVDDSGWKQVHGDVFRLPHNPMLLSAVVGTGAQLLVLFCVLLIFALVGTFYTGNRGALYSASVLLYAFTASISGFVSSSLYKQLGGEKWATNAIITASMYTVPFFFTFAVLNTIAIIYGSTVALPFSTIFGIIALWALVTFPLTVLGAARGRRSTRRFEAPCKTNRVRREIPSPPWYQSRYVHMFMAGFLPFSGQYIELHYCFAAIWGHQVYRLFGMLFAAFVITLIITSFVTIALTYFQLASEDYQWWWRSFYNGGATGIFVYLYSVVFFVYRSHMSGILQTSYFFGYMLMISYAIFLMLGTVGFASSLPFVKHIYGSIKSD